MWYTGAYARPHFMGICDALFNGFNIIGRDIQLAVPWPSHCNLCH